MNVNSPSNYFDDASMSQPSLISVCCQHEPSPQVVISRQTAYRPTPLNGQCVILCGNNTHAWDYVTCAWQRSVRPAARQLKESTQHQM